MRQDMNMDEIMEYQGRLYFMPRKEIKRRTEELLEFCDLIKFRKRTVRKLSGGMKRKLMVCRALLTDPEILLLDEPTQGIDVGAKADIYQLIDRLAREGMGVIVVSSDLIEIINLSNRIVVMRDGQAIKTLESDELTEENVMLYAMGVNADEKA